MAKDMVDEIRKAERVGEEIIENAKIQAKERLSSAAAQAKELLTLTEKQSEKDAAGIIADAEKAAEEIKRQAGERSWAEAEKLSARADKTRAQAVEAAIGILTE